MTAYYNEIDPFCAEWLRNLVKAGHIAYGEVDERSIEDVSPADLRGYTQCHFFAGIGVWSGVARAAGWPDDRPLWTGSCPCQPFSAAGKGAGLADERHLWPAFHHLIRIHRPTEILGEQVASKAGLAWMELVQTDLEAEGYAVAPFDLCAAGFADPETTGRMGGAHIRQRLYWGARRLGNADDAGPQGRRRSELSERAGQRIAGEAGASGGLADSDGGNAGAEREQCGGEQRLQPADGGVGGLADADKQGSGGRGVQRPGESVEAGFGAARERPSGLRQDHLIDWLPCRDGKFRPVESGTFPLANEDTQRVGRLRAYGNALDKATAQAFITAWMECAP